MELHGFEVKVGEAWRTISGGVVTIVVVDESKWHVKCSDGLWRAADGRIDDLGCSMGDLAFPLSAGAARRLDSEENAKTLATCLASMEHTKGEIAYNALIGNPGTTMNPKDAIGSTKLPLHLWPAEASALGCLGMLEGASKYGRNNYIAGHGVIATIYIDAAKRHLDAWMSGEECAPDTGTPHLANALATLAILVKARAHDRLIDDRDFAPNPGYRKLVDELTPHVKRIQEMFADKAPKHFTIADNPERAA